MKKILFATACCLVMTSCGERVTTSPSSDAPDIPQKTTLQRTAPSVQIGEWGIDLSVRDTTIAPGENFFAHMNGKWLATFEIPDEFSRYGAFTALSERSEKQVRKIIDDAAHKGSTTGGVQQKIGDYYSSFLDIEAIDAAGLAPAQKGLNLIDAASTHEDIAKLFGTVNLSSQAPFGGYVDIDSKNTKRYIFYMTQSGLGMPNRDFYLEESFADKQEAYKNYLQSILELLDTDNGQARVAAVYALEERMARVHWAPAQRRDRDRTYNIYTLDEVKAYAPEFPWTAMLEQAGLGDTREYILRENDAIQALAALFADTPVAVWKDYLKIHYIGAHASVLPRQIDQIHFGFFGTELYGIPSQKERWKRGVSAVNGGLGEAVGQLYVQQHFPESSRDMMQDLVGNLKIAFAKRLAVLDWMSDATKLEAHTKLENFSTKIGYPEKWKDYSAFTVIRGDAFGNFARAQKFIWEDMIAKLGNSIDHTEWFMTPQMVNAYYSPTRNEIVFPAAILQAPFFDPMADPAVNYGGIGAVIGHEISHGFDDQGRKSDGFGVLRNWWTETDAKNFNVRAEILGRQYASYSPVEGHFIDPLLTMGENIADLAGLTVAYEAYKLSLKGKAAPIIDGLTGDQRFFLSWAQVWQTKYREDALRNRLSTDPHSPAEYRTNGVVRNMDAWYEAFDIREDDSLYLPPEKRVRLW